jgi:hypothetical protein
VIYNISRALNREQIENSKTHIRSDSILSSDVAKVSVSPNGEFLALAEKHGSKVTVRLFPLLDLEEVQRFET